MATPPTPVRQQAIPLSRAKLLSPDEAREYEEAGGGEYVNPLDPDASRWIKVRLASSHVEEFMYNAKTRQLFVTFQPDAKGFMAKGVYENVPLQTYLEFRESPSFGSFVGNQLKKHFVWRRLNYSLKPKNS